MAKNKGKHTEPGRRRTARGARVGFVAVGVLAASLLAGVGAGAAEADVVGVRLCAKISTCDVVTPNGVRWQ